MNEFERALVADEKSSAIPEGCDLFGPMVGSWDIEWVDQYEDGAIRRVEGEWIFSRVLEGLAIQDVFICPSRRTRTTDIQPDAEYGTTLRIYNPETGAWDVFYGCSGEAIRMEARRVGPDIVLTEVMAKEMRWIFDEITDHSFHWVRFVKQPDGKWKTVGEVYAVRRKESL